MCTAYIFDYIKRQKFRSLRETKNRLQTNLSLQILHSVCRLAGKGLPRSFEQRGIRTSDRSIPFFVPRFSFLSPIVFVSRWRRDREKRFDDDGKLVHVWLDSGFYGTLADKGTNFIVISTFFSSTETSLQIRNIII